jgi:hypothetical protein
MNKIVAIIFLLTLSFASCKKDGFNGITASHPDVPVTVSNLFGFYNGVPTVSTSVTGGGAVTITLAIPAGSGRTIKEITRVAVATTPSNYKVVEVSTGLYNAAPIIGSGTSVTFTTSLTEYTAKTGLAVTTSGTATSFLARYFMFLVTLDNGEQLFPMGVRVYVNS